MKLDEELVMALPRKLVESTILGLYDPVSQHLVKLVGFEFPDETRQHFRRELRTWLRKIQRLRIKPQNGTGSTKFYFDLLFDYPFGGVEDRNMRLIIDEILDDYETCVRQRHRKRWSNGSGRFIRRWPSACIMAMTCST